MKQGGGGEGGEVITGTSIINSGNTYNITVGTGGQNSSFNGLTAITGANGTDASSSNDGVGGSGVNGGNGGTLSNGFNGPQIIFSDNDASGVYFGGGGGAGAYNGGLVGGGNGGQLAFPSGNSLPGSSGNSNTGGGGGGGTSSLTGSLSVGGQGGSGVVLLYFTIPDSKISITPSYIQFPDNSQQVVAPGQPQFAPLNIITSAGQLQPNTATITASTGNLITIPTLPRGTWFLEGQLDLSYGTVPSSNTFITLGFSNVSGNFNTSGNYTQDFYVPPVTGKKYFRITSIINQTVSGPFYLIGQHHNTIPSNFSQPLVSLTYTRLS